MRIFKVGELRRAIRESAGEKNEFKPVFGSNVQSDDKKINDKAYKEIMKDTEKYNSKTSVNKSKKYDGGLSKDDNQSMSDLLYDNISEPFSKRVKAQMKGYASAEAEKLHKNDAFGNAVYGTDDDVEKRKEHSDERKRGKDTATEIGLTGRKLDKKEVEKLHKSVYENKIKRLTFHKVFLSENHMLANIPDSLKEENNRFIMRDSNGTEYLVEWHQDGADVKKKVGKKLVNEEMNHIKHLFNYKCSDYNKNSTPDKRLNETKEFDDMLNKARKLMK